MIVTLRPYQDYFYNKFFENIRNGIKNVCIAAYTGTGKTYMSAAIAEKYLQNGGIVIFIAPRINLVYQTIKSFDHLGRIQIIQGSKKFDDNGNIYIASLQTLVRRNLAFSPSLIIHDERHNGFKGKSSKKVMEKFPNCDYLSLTATPFDAKGYPLKGFGSILNYKTIQWYIDNNYLVDCDCYAPVMPDLASVKTTAGDYNEKDLDSVMNNDVMIGNIIEKTKDMIIGKKTLFFAVTIAHAEAVAKQYSDAGFSAVAYHSKLDTTYREEIIKKFENGSIDILVSVSALVMGFDVPDVNCIIVARPTKSQSFYRQLIGRGMRPFPGKLFCLLIDCAGVIKENGMPNEEVVPKPKSKRLKKTMTCVKCEKSGRKNVQAKSVSKSIRKINGKLMYVTTWMCKWNHSFETEKEVGETICPSCSKVIISGKAQFKEDDLLYTVFTECECGEEIIIRTIPKIETKLAKIQKSKVTIVDLINKIGKSTPEDQRDTVNKFLRYVLDIIHVDMQEQCLSSMYVSLSMGLPEKEIESNLMQAIVDASLRTNKFKCLSPRLIKMAYNQTKDPVNIMYIHNSRSINPMNPSWAKKTMMEITDFTHDFPKSEKWILNSIKTRCKNIHKRSQKMASLFYFIGMLREKEQYGGNDGL